MKVGSFNVNSLRARLPVVLEWLSAEQPDVLCVQETKVQDVDFPAEAIKAAGYSSAFRGQKSYNGVAIFSRGPMDNVCAGLDDEPRDEPRLIRARVNGVVIVNTYVPQGYMPASEQYAYKLHWFERLLEYFRKYFKPTDAIVWAGDLNVAPESKDVYDEQGLMGHVCFNPQVQKVLQSVMQWGFVDVFRKHCGDAGQYTFWDYRLGNSVKRNLGWRLDHIMATAPLAQKAVACYIDKKPRLAERPSDHTPIVAEFDI